jgi:hypothetical protein
MKVDGDAPLRDDPEDPGTDLYLRLAYSVARALVVARRKDASGAEADCAIIDESLLDIKKRLEQLEGVTTWAQTAKSSAEMIEARMRLVKEALSASRRSRCTLALCGT